VNGNQLFASPSPIAARVASIASGGGGMSVSRFSIRRMSRSSPAAAATRSILKPGMVSRRRTLIGCLLIALAANPLESTTSTSSPMLFGDGTSTPLPRWMLRYPRSVVPERDVEELDAFGEFVKVESVIWVIASKFRIISDKGTNSLNRLPPRHDQPLDPLGVWAK